MKFALATVAGALTMVVAVQAGVAAPGPR